MRRRRTKVSAEERRLRKELANAVFALLVRLAGETFKDKLVRSILVGAFGLASYYYDLNPVDIDVALPTPTQIIQSGSK